MNLTNKRTCVVHNCQNTSDLGEFVGDVCSPCHRFIVLGKGSNSQVYKNAVNHFIQTANIEISHAVQDLKTLLSTLERK